MPNRLPDRPLDGTMPFGKWRGVPIEHVCSDYRYLNWLSDQPWLAKTRPDVALALADMCAVYAEYYARMRDKLHHSIQAGEQQEAVRTAAEQRGFCTVYRPEVWQSRPAQHPWPGEANDGN